mmetsp:Transcript_17390/g.43733  ORF Transcript_17390/g.43733 Transcript_17390/m.43733 type:complete len:132 (-) Transcript_17390:1344-1739(-)
MVDSRCATTMEVRPTMMWSSASCTTRSLAASSADVASSSSRMRGALTTARAIATRCFCPPLSCTPRSPTCVLYPSGRAAMKSCALAARAAASTSSRLASGRPYRMFSSTLVENSNGSWDTSPICARSQRRL